MLETMILRWGYVAVGAGTFIEGEAVLIAAGTLAHRGLLSLPLVMAVAFAGSLGGDQLWFYVGRRYGRRFLERHRRWHERSVRAHRWLARYGLSFVIGFRFVYGLRLVTPLWLGASGYPAPRFLVLNVLGGAIWAVALAGLGWALGASMQALLARAARVEELLAVTAAIALAIWMAHWAIRRRRRARRREQGMPDAAVEE